ncbi:MAG: endonuclease/exonuclease/phosphatase family protein [Verrucomicrobiota bacterium]|nr:endonuclease/exonuclease/phosphatase family protein [Verrucomicrobiota bacterium]
MKLYKVELCMNLIPSVRLILNFDLNGTLILHDSSKNVSRDYMILSALADNTFAKWDEQHGTMSYKEYAYQVLCPGDKSDPIIKEERKKIIGTFLERVREHVISSTVVEQFKNIKEKFTDSKRNIFPSFYALMAKLREMNIPFTIILRTFGNDLPEVVKEIEEHSPEVKFRHWAKFEDAKFILDGKETAMKAGEIFQTFSKHHLAVQDDWKTWNKNQERGDHGKPFFYDRSGECLSLFFDDNATGIDQDIVNPCEVTGQNLPKKDLMGQLIFPVNTKEAMLEDDYYVKRVLSQYLQQELETKTIFSPENRSFKFLSYNIQLNGLDTPTHLWKDRKYAVSRLISYADIIALQEATHSQLADLQALLPEYEFASLSTVTGKELTIGSSDQNEGLLIAFRKDAFLLKSNDMTWFSDTPSIPSLTWKGWTGAFPKAMQRATLICLSNQKELAVLNSHFPHDEDPSINPRFLSSQFELQILKELKDRIWISAGDRNFHHPRDISAYQLYAESPGLVDSKKSASVAQGDATFIGYEDHPRKVPISPAGAFEKANDLDVIFHNPHQMSSQWWLAHPGEYDSDLKLLPIGPCRDPAKRQFASDHAAIFVKYTIHS